jgi:hypothetical protein
MPPPVPSQQPQQEPGVPASIMQGYMQALMMLKDMFQQGQPQQPTDPNGMSQMSMHRMAEFEYPGNRPVPMGVAGSGFPVWQQPQQEPVPSPADIQKTQELMDMIYQRRGRD